VVVCILHVATSASSDELCDALAPDASSPAPGEPGGATRPGACPDGMIEIEGEFCPALEQTCIRRPAQMSYRCLEYARPSGACEAATSKKHFCVDTYEWPNEAGAKPVVMKDWWTARKACRAIGKRLCTEDEWTLACEGPEHLPYPYGFERDDQACNIDKPHIAVNEKALTSLSTRARELARLWQGERSGSRERCVSSFGVHDMTGNVDEWTLNETGKPHHSALKGGYWSWVRGRCRPVTPGHDEGFKYYNIGWRCCADVKGEDATSTPTSTSTPTPTPTPTFATPAPTPQKGSIAIPPSAAGHRVFVDGRVIGERRLVVVACGRHVVRIGHDGRDQPLDVPCGGEVSASFP
jgi:hypothetical protein